MTEIFKQVKLSTVNYDGLLTGWSAQNLRNGVNLDGGTGTYSNSALSARDTLTNVHGWPITNGGVED